MLRTWYDQGLLFLRFTSDEHERWVCTGWLILIDKLGSFLEMKRDPDHVLSHIAEASNEIALEVAGTAKEACKLVALFFSSLDLTMSKMLALIKSFKNIYTSFVIIHT